MQVDVKPQDGSICSAAQTWMSYERMSSSDIHEFNTAFLIGELNNCRTSEKMTIATGL